MMMHFTERSRPSIGSRDIWLDVHTVQFVRVVTSKDDGKPYILVEMVSNRSVFLCHDEHPVDTIQQVIESINLGRVAQPNNL